MDGYEAGESIACSAVYRRGGHRPSPSRECLIAQLLDAASSGDSTTVAMLVDSQQVGVDSRQWSPRRIAPRVSRFWPHFGAEADCTALHCALAHGHSNVALLLLARNAAPNVRTRHGATPLMLAAFNGCEDIVEALCERGTHVLDAALLSHTDTTLNGPTALHLACCAADPGSAAAAVRLLLRAGANPNVLSGGCLSPLHFAAARLHTDACAALVAAGAYVSLVDDARRTPREIAQCADGCEMARRCTLEALGWLPSVRLLWIGHSCASRAEGANNASGAGGGARSDGGSGGNGGDSCGDSCGDRGGDSGGDRGGDRCVADPSILTRLTRDTLRLVCDAVVASHRPESPNRQAPAADSHATQGSIGPGKRALPLRQDDGHLLAERLAHTGLEGGSRAGVRITTR